MYPSHILIFSFFLLIYWFFYKVLGNKFALDQPDVRKQHLKVTPQIGGIVFGPGFILLSWFLGLAPHWYIIGGLVSVILGATDDIYTVPWIIKLIVQLIIAIFIAIIFWNRFESITFFNYTMPVNQNVLFAIYLFWFIGIYNAVNLIDGLDGLAGGFTFLLCFSIAISNLGIFSIINGILSIIILGFLIFNQRPAKIFMGDAGSLFLGFHIAVLPLLFYDLSEKSALINITPFVIMVSYLVADTTRVFFTRLAAKKNPMTADTIHFHHLIIQQSGSYLSSISSIYFVTLVSVILAMISFHATLSTNVMLGYLALLFLFILTPPVETYVPLIAKTVKPLYNWQKNEKLNQPYLPRTIFMIFLFIGLFVSLFYSVIQFNFYNWHYLLSIFFFGAFIINNFKNKMSMYVIQLIIIILFIESSYKINMSIFTQIFSILIFVSYIIFLIEKRSGCNVKMYSSLDILIFLISIGGTIFSLLGYYNYFWFSLITYSLWFSVSFILRRTIYL